MKIYGKPEPPEYKIENITAPIFLTYSSNDYIVDENVSIVISELENYSYLQRKIENRIFNKTRMIKELKNKRIFS
mgnify:CR=1 FL=1